MLPIRIAFFLLKVIIKFVIEIIEVRIFIGKWVVTLQIVVITDVEVFIGRFFTIRDLNEPKIPCFGNPNRPEFPNISL